VVKANQSQSRWLEDIRIIVFEVMATLDKWSSSELAELKPITLGVLRSTATRRHGVTRWRLGSTPPLIAKKVDTIDLHPQLLTEKWLAYGAKVLFHEYLHALGNIKHDAGFKRLESLWPSKEAKGMGRSFTTEMCKVRAQWIWRCVNCNLSHSRQRRSNGRYQCRKCGKLLLDEVNIG
jgi:predicted SprT family Zn-dependent metalloprotease